MITPVGWRLPLVVLLFAFSAVLVRAEPQRINVRLVEITGATALKTEDVFGAKLSYLPDAEVDNQLKLMVLAGVGQVLGSEVSGIKTTDPFADKLSDLPDGEVIALSFDTPAKVSANAIEDAASKSEAKSGVKISCGGNEQEWTIRNVGVELELQQIVSEDASILLKTTIKRTTFEGFVEYGGKEVVVSGGMTVKIPSGFYQPIFAVDIQDETLTIKPGVTTVLRMDWTERDQQKKPEGLDQPLLGTFVANKNGNGAPRIMLILLSTAAGQ